MKISHQVLRGLGITAMCALFIVTVAQAENGKAPESGDFEFGPIEIIKGSVPMSEARRAMMESEEYQRSMAADRELARREREAMAERGYIDGAEQTFDAHDHYVNSPSMSTAADIESLLAYRPAALRIGLPVVGIVPDEPLEDGLIHDTTVVLEHEKFGLMFVRERSLATEPRTTSKYIYAPRFDMQVNGNPALLSVFKSPDGSKGRTVLSILTDTQLLHVSLGQAVMANDKDFNELMRIAGLL